MRFLAILLFPFTLIYDLVTRFRNYLYKIEYKRSFEFETCVIAVGNLSVGGTGKSPMIEYIVNLLQSKYSLTTLSRGYGRKTNGFRLADTDDDYKSIGDEPMQFYKKFENVGVAVGEERAVAIPFILAERPETQVILLDDAYQHRSVKPQCNILLTDFNKPFFNDFILPSGRLREARKGASRADVVVVTKCPEELDDKQIADYKYQIGEYSNAPVFFCAIRYLAPVPVFDKNDFSKNVYLFSGIANTSTLKKYIDENFNLIGEMTFKDHHDYSIRNIDALINDFQKSNYEDKCFLTTEKDMVKLLTPEIANKFKNIAIYYLPIETYFINSGNKFDDIVLKTVNSNLH